MDDPVAQARRQRAAAAMPQPERIRDEMSEKVTEQFFDFLQNFTLVSDGDGDATSMTGSQLHSASVHHYVHLAQTMKYKN